MNTQFTCGIIGIFLTFYLGGILILLADKETPTKSVKPQIISGDFRRLYKVEIPVTVCG